MKLREILSFLLDCIWFHFSDQELVFWIQISFDLEDLNLGNVNMISGYNFMISGYNFKNSQK